MNNTNLTIDQIVKTINNVPKKYWLSILLSLFLVTIFTFRINTLNNEYVTRHNPYEKDKADKKDKPKTETQLLFETLIKSKSLITIEDDNQITLPAKDYALAHKVNGLTLSDKDESLLKRLYNSTSGKALQQQIKLWNHSRLFAAVRDNIPQSNKHTESAWTATNHWKEKTLSSDWVPLNFGYINGGSLLIGFNDWISVADNMPLVFSRQINVHSKQTITIQIIGQPDIHKLPGKKILFACSPLTKKERKNGTEKKCQKINAPSPDISAYIVKLQLNAGLYKISLPVSPATNTEKNINGLAISLTKDNQFQWNKISEYHRNPIATDNSNNNFIITTQDGKPLINRSDASPSKYTLDNGLVPLIGYEKSDRYALTGIISHSNLPNEKMEIGLTLDSYLQQSAQKQLLKEISTLGKEKKYTKLRRAAVVLMNPQTGAILAAANYPVPPKGIHRWDRLSFSKLYPNRDAFGVNAWQGLDNNNAPGSTFKTVTALAALQAVDEGRDDLEKMIKGLSPRAFEAHTGLPISSYQYQPDPENKPISNAGKAPLSIALPYRTPKKKLVRRKLRITGGEGCPSRPVYTKNLGMKEAIKKSLNVWFARLGVMMDEQNLSEGGKGTNLVEMAHRLGFGETVSSLVSDEIPLNRIIGHYRKNRGDVLNAFGGNLDLGDSRLIKKELADLQAGRISHSTAIQRLAQNSIGQGLSTTPLQMAKVASSIATGKIPQPYLISKWANKDIKPVKAKKLKLSLIKYLKLGMKAVPEVGTASNAFNHYYKQGRCRTYGKTGTAQTKVAKKSGANAAFNSTWFIGWHENNKSIPDVSFACMVTHAYAKGKRSGGTVCAPIIARILKDMANKSKKQEKKQ